MTVQRIARAVERSWRVGGVLPYLLTPLAWAYRAGVGVRNAMYDRGVRRSQPLGAPTLSVGNLTVGGTGKTPVSAWLAQEVLRRGHRPAILLRGYGADEPEVHRRLTPGALVVPDADRIRGAARARAEGAQIFVLDDGFQHRRVLRDLDLVLVAAEQGVPRRLLPAGPLREPAEGIARASALVVTRKSATLAEAAAVATAWSHFTRGIPIIICALPLDALHSMAPAGDPVPLETLVGQRILAVAGVGDPTAFADQLRAAGAEVTLAAYPDHAPFTDAEVRALSERADGFDRVVCTLKDAVKVGARWPRSAPRLWYLSQRVVIERGGEALASLLDRAIAARDG